MNAPHSAPLAVLAPALALVLAAASPARASIIDGSFTGTVTSGSLRTGPGAPPDISGSPVTGVFDLASIATATQIPTSGDPSAYATYTLAPGSLSYAFTVVSIAQTYGFGTASGSTEAITLTDDGTTQSLQLDAGFADGHTAAFIDLVAPEGSLFSAVTDLASLHTGPGTTLQSPSTFGVYAIGYATVAITGATFAQPVPEPAAWTLLAAALPLAFTAAVRRRRPPVA